MTETVAPERTSSITKDPFIKDLLTRIPKESQNSFSEEQLLGLKIALSGRKWGRHAVDVRGTLGLWRWKYYYVFICGREQRTLTRREAGAARLANTIFLLTFVTFSGLLALTALYMLKSALGIDLFPADLSSGILDWFKDI